MVRYRHETKWRLHPFLRAVKDIGVKIIEALTYSSRLTRSVDGNLENYCGRIAI